MTHYPYQLPVSGFPGKRAFYADVSESEKDAHRYAMNTYRIVEPLLSNGKIQVRDPNLRIRKFFGILNFLNTSIA